MSSKRIVITGSSKGIGRFLTESYLAEGYVIAGCSRSSSDLVHENYTHFEVDVAEDVAVSRMVKAVKKKLGGIDILLNNAGMAAMNHCLTTPSSTAQKIYSVNVLGSFYFLREVGKQMVRKKYGRIVNFSTVAKPLRLEGEAVYASSKAALETLTAVTANELGEFGVTVNAVGPTPIDTDLTRAVPKKKMQELVEKQAIKRLGKFEDVKNVIDFFINDKSDFITGQVVYLGGVG